MARKSRKNLEAVAAVPEKVYYKAAAYVRLSADVKRKPSDSLENQRLLIENFISTSPDIKLVSVYSDNYSTGTSFERPAFQKMLCDAEAGRINCIITKDLTRFGRNAIDAGYYLEKYLPSLNVRFIAITDNFDSNDGDGGILLPIKNVLAESYALDIGRKCRAVQRQNIKDGRFVGRIAPYGFALDPNDCHKLVIDPEAANVVRQIFELALNGATLGEIARHLNESKILTPSSHKLAQGIVVNNSQGAKYWSPHVITDMLCDRMYIGDMVQGKTQTTNHRETRILPSDWVIVPNTHQAIIDRELFETVQKIRKQIFEAEKAKETNRGAYSENLFKCKVYCAKCGCLMNRKRQNKDGIYWFRCESTWKYSKNTCTVVSVKEAELKEEILAILHKHAETILGRFINADRETDLADNAYEKELREIKTQLDKNSKVLKSLYESMISGLITPDEFKQMKSDYQAKITALSNRADEIRNNKYTTQERRNEYKDLADAVSAAISDDRLTGEMIDRLVEKIMVHPDKSFEIHFKFRNEFAEVCRIAHSEVSA